MIHNLIEPSPETLPVVLQFSLFFPQVAQFYVGSGYRVKPRTDLRLSPNSSSIIFLNQKYCDTMGISFWKNVKISLRI